MISLFAFIKTTPTEVVPSPPIKPLNETLEILSKVNEFYDASWNKLIFLLVGAFTILGVFMPIIIQHFQTKALRASEAEIEAKLKKALEKEFSVKLEEKIGEFKNETKKNHNLFSALLLQFNANTLFEKGEYYKSLMDYTGAISFYIGCNELSGLRTVLDNINNSMSNLAEAELEKLKDDEDIDLITNLKDIFTLDNSAILRDRVNQIIEKLN